MFTFKVLEVKLDFPHVMFYVTRWCYDLCTLDQFPAVINGIEKDRQPGFQCYVIKSLFPVRIQE